MAVQIGYKDMYAFLWLSPFLIAILGTLSAIGIGAGHYAMAGLLAAAVLLAAWRLGGDAYRSRGDYRRKLFLSGVVFVLVWASLFFIVVMGPPQGATAAENGVRYVLLAVDAVIVAAGAVLLREAIMEAGGHLFSSLGAAFVQLATPLYVLFSAIGYLTYRSTDDGALVLPAGSALEQLALLLLLVAVALTYLGVALTVVALRGTALVKQGTARVFVASSLIALLCVAITSGEVLLMREGPLGSAARWYAFPGAVLAIPAIPWFLLSFVGFVLIRKAREETLGRVELLEADARAARAPTRDFT
jgi:hypothetical protein